MSEAAWFEAGRHGDLIHHGVVLLFGFGRRDVADGLQQPAVVEPVDPFQRGGLDGLERPPSPAQVDDLGLVEPIDGLGERVVIAVAYFPEGQLSHSRRTEFREARHRAPRALTDVMS